MLSDPIERREMEGQRRDMTVPEDTAVAPPQSLMPGRGGIREPLKEAKQGCGRAHRARKESQRRPVAGSHRREEGSTAMAPM